MDNKAEFPHLGFSRSGNVDLGNWSSVRVRQALSFPSTVNLVVSKGKTSRTKLGLSVRSMRYVRKYIEPLKN